MFPPSFLDFYGFTGTTPFADSWFLIQNLLYSTVNYNFFLKSALKRANRFETMRILLLRASKKSKFKNEGGLVYNNPKTCK